MSFGWDIAPRLMTRGIWRPIELIVADSGRLTDAGVRTLAIDGDIVRAEVIAGIEWTGPAEADVQLHGHVGDIPFAVGFYHDCADTVLLTSRAGSTRYDRTFMEAFVHPGLGEANWGTHSNYPLAGILPCGTDAMMFDVTRHYMQQSWHIERLLLRTDGFASVTAPWSGGEMLTRPFIFTGNALEINYRTSAPGFIRVEIQTADGSPMPGYTLQECPEIVGDDISYIVAWKNGADVSRLGGQPVRLRFVMKDADLYVLQFRMR